MTYDRDQDKAQELESRLTALETTVSSFMRLADGNYTRAQELERRLTTLEITVKELKRVAEGRAALWFGLAGSTAGGIVLELVLRWMSRK